MELQISKAGTLFSCSDEERAAVRQRFDRTHIIRLPRFIAPDLLTDLQEMLECAGEIESSHDVGEEVNLVTPKADALIEFILNDDKLFKAVDALTGCGDIGCFSGRVYVLHSRAGHEFGWHSDLVHDRLLALSVNLGKETYEGGVLEIAERASRTVMQRASNVVRGDALLIRLGAELVHRVTPVAGPVPKITYAGWFCSRPSYHDTFG